jgi:ArsR family transcriptional regulator
MNEILSLYKSLADETRLRILALLLWEGELCVCDIIAALKLPQSTISRQLAILRKAGWVNDRRCGLWIYYSIRDSRPHQMELIPLLKKQLLNTEASARDREALAAFGCDNNCA